MSSKQNLFTLDNATLMQEIFSNSWRLYWLPTEHHTVYIVGVSLVGERSVVLIIMDFYGYFERYKFASIYENKSFFTRNIKFF